LPGNGLISPNPAARYFQTSFRLARFVFLFAEYPRPSFEAGADPFSPQGVRSIGPRLLEN
jgi:hypothetical protein